MSEWSVNSQRAARRCKMEDAFGRRVASAEQWYVLASASIKVFFVDLNLDHSRSADTLDACVVGFEHTRGRLDGRTDFFQSSRARTRMTTHGIQWLDWVGSRMSKSRDNA